MKRKTRRGGAALQNIAALRKKANQYATYAKDQALLVRQNLTQLETAHQSYEERLQDGAREILLAPSINSHSAYYMETVLLRYSVIRRIVEEQLPQQRLEQVLTQHAEFANRAADLAKNMTANARVHRMSADTDREINLQAIHAMNEARSRLEENIASMESPEEGQESAALDAIQGWISRKPDAVSNSLHKYVVKLIPKSSTSHLLTVELDPKIKWEGIITQQNVYVLQEWVRVSMDLLRVMKSLLGKLEGNKGERSRMAIQQNIGTTYKTAMVVAYVYYRAQESLLERRKTLLIAKGTTKAGTNTIQSIGEELMVRKAERQFYHVLMAWWNHVLPLTADPKTKGEFMTKQAMVKSYLPLLDKFIRTRTMNTRKNNKQK